MLDKSGDGPIVRHPALPKRSPPITLFRDIAGRTVTTLHGRRGPARPCRRSIGISELRSVRFPKAPTRQEFRTEMSKRRSIMGCRSILHKTVFSPRRAMWLPRSISRRSGPSVTCDRVRTVRRRALEDAAKVDKVDAAYSNSTDRADVWRAGLESSARSTSPQETNSG